jgi:hypothetical protein
MATTFARPRTLRLEPYLLEDDSALPPRFIRRLGELGDRPAVVMAVALLAAGIYVLFRLDAFGWDPSRFVVAGSEYVTAGAPSTLAVLPGSGGYDGQFFFRLALDPFTTTRIAHGIILDLPAYRQQRIVYPLLAWLFSGGNPVAAAWALIGVNVAAYAGLGYLAGSLARSYNRNALLGLIVVAYPGFLMSLSRDLCEIVATFFLLASLLALRKQRYLSSALLMTLAILSKETTIVVAGAMGLDWVLTLVRNYWRARHGRPALHNDWCGWAKIVFLVPLLVESVWQVVLDLTWGTTGIPPGRLDLILPLSAFGLFLARAAAHVQAAVPNKAPASVSVKAVAPTSGHAASGGGPLSIASSPYAAAPVVSHVGTVPMVAYYLGGGAVGVGQYTSYLLHLVSLTFIFVLVTALAMSVRKSAAPRSLKLAFWLALLLIASTPRIPWNDDSAFLRSLAPLMLLGTFTLMANRRTRDRVAIGILGGMGAIVWIWTAATIFAIP